MINNSIIGPSTLHCKSVQICLSEAGIPEFTGSPLPMIIITPLQSTGTAQSSVNMSPKKQRHNSFVHCTPSRHLQSTVLVENYIFNDNKTVQTLLLYSVTITRLQSYHTGLLLFFVVHCSHPSLIQSNYAAIHPQANQTFNSLMEPHFIIGLCSETNKQSSSRLVIPLTATHAELAKLAANKVYILKKKKTFEEA